MTTVERSRTTSTEAAEIMPFGGWEAAPDSVASRDGEALFRFPAADDPAPGTARLLVMSFYAAALGFGAIGVGIAAMITVIGGAAYWYVPMLVFFGLLSVGLAAASFLAIHRPALPWLLLLAATVPLAVDIAVAALY